MLDPSDRQSSLAPEVLRYYNSYNEAERLFRGSGELERLRTQEIIARSIPRPPATIYDIGGGPGVHAFWLAAQGHTVHLLDAVPRHIEQVREAAQQRLDEPLASAQVGDARHLPFADESADAVLLCGPLYHLVERADRLQALREARRVLRPGGWLYAAAVSRFAPLFEGFFRIPQMLLEPGTFEMIRQDLINGQHRNPTEGTTYFTTTYFHHPAELEPEITEAGLNCEVILPVEGPIWISSEAIAHWQDEQWREQYLSLLREIENEPALSGTSAHLLAVARKV